MANEYTSVATTPGLSTELVQDAYDLAVRWALKGIPSARQFVSVKPQRPAMTGSSITIERLNYLSNATITAGKAALTEEADVDSVKLPAPTPVTITPAEHGMVVTSTRKLANRTFTGVEPIKAQNVAHAMARVIDELIQDTMVSGTPVYNNGNVANGTITNAHELTASDVRRQVSKLRAANVMPWFGGFYAAYVHPFVVHDLREETGSGAWRVPKEYGTDQSDIWTGEVGEFEGVRFVQSNLTRVTANGLSSANVFNTFFVGQQALAEHVVEEPHVVVSPQLDKLGRFHSLGWYGDFGHAIFEPKALVNFRTGSSLGADYVASA